MSVFLLARKGARVTGRWQEEESCRCADPGLRSAIEELKIQKWGHYKVKRKPFCKMWADDADLDGKALYRVLGVSIDASNEGKRPSFSSTVTMLNNRLVSIRLVTLSTELRKAYREKICITHPDKVRLITLPSYWTSKQVFILSAYTLDTKGGNAAEFSSVRHAFEVLSDPVQVRDKEHLALHV